MVTFTADDGLRSELTGGVVIGFDGTVWAEVRSPEVDEDPALVTYSYFDGDTWVDVGAPNPPGVLGMDPEAGPDRTLWLIGTGFDTSGGTHRYDQEWTSVEGMSAESLATGAAAPDGSLWGIDLSDTDGEIALTRFDGRTWTPQPAPPEGIECVFCVDYKVDADGVLWMHTSEGVSSFDGDTWTPVVASLPEPEAEELRFLGPDRGWVLGVDGASWILHVDSELGPSWMRITEDDVVRVPIDVGAVEVDETCRLEREPGVAPLVDDDADVTSALVGLIAGMAGDANGDVWAATECVGVTHTDVETGTVTVYGIDDGFPSLHVHGIAAHPDGSVWVASDGGVTRIEP